MLTVATRPEEKYLLSIEQQAMIQTLLEKVAEAQIKGKSGHVSKHLKSKRLMSSICILLKTFLYVDMQLLSQLCSFNINIHIPL